MNKQKVIILIVAVNILAVLSCKKESNNQANSQLSKLPPATQTGANTFGYLVNGNAVVSNKLFCSFVPSSTLPGNTYFSFTLIATDSTSTGKQTISIYIPGITLFTNNTSFGLNGPPNAPDRWYADYNNVAGDGFANDYQTTYPLTESVSYANPIVFSKIDTVNKIFSGTFSFCVINSSNTTLPVTEGRFDVHYVTN